MSRWDEVALQADVERLRAENEKLRAWQRDASRVLLQHEHCGSCAATVARLLKEARDL